MSVERGGRFASAADEYAGPGPFRLLALGGVLVLLSAFVSVLRDVTVVVGGTQSLSIIVIAMLLVATVLSRLIRPVTAVLLGVLAAVGGLVYYLDAVGIDADLLLSRNEELFSDVVALVSGLPILRMVEVDIWTIGFAPAPVFLTWYLALKRRYALCVVPGGLALYFLVLTGDASTPVTLVGTVGGVAAVGFGELERRGGSIAQADVIAILVAVMLVTSLSVSVLPGNGETPGSFAGAEDARTLEGTLDPSPERSAISGSVDLSPEVRFTVESTEGAYWRTGVYDRFTGDEWIQTGENEPYEGGIDPPPGEYRTVEQQVTAETGLNVMPAAAHPIAVDDDAGLHTTVSDHGQVYPEAMLLSDDAYTVESAVPTATASDLDAAGTEYPDHVEERYRQLPEGVTEEFEAYTEAVTEDAETPYETAVAVEQYLRTEKGYSLDVDRPDGNVAEAFLFEMDEGYCVYFATTMVQMLRAEDVPARYVTGYTAGEQVEDDRWVVRGLDAHAWVEVYFPGEGWVAFEPTPSDSRDAVHDQRLEEARDDGIAGVDLEDDEDEDEAGEGEDGGEDEADDEADPDEDSIEDEVAEADAADEEGEEPAGDEPDDDDEDEGDEGELPGDDSGDDESVAPWSGDRPGIGDVVATLTQLSPEAIGAGVVLLIGLAASVRRTSLAPRTRRTLRPYWQGVRSDPNRDAERAFDRLEALLERTHRSRRPTESINAYCSALDESGDEGLDPRIIRVCRTVERARYGDGVDRATADEAIELVDRLVLEHVPIGGRVVRWRSDQDRIDR